MYEQMYTGLIYVDLQKACDTLDHQILLEKTKYFGFGTSAIKWFLSYPSNRKVLLCIDSAFSKGGTLNYGVPQAFILGTFLFLLLIYDFL